VKRALLSTVAVMAALVFACGIDVSGVGPEAPLDDGGADARVTPRSDGAAKDGGTFDVAPGTVTLTVEASDIVITSNVGEISCPKAACSAELGVGQKVTLTAITGEDRTVTGWSEPSCGREPTCEVTMNASRTITATVATHVDHMHAAGKLYTMRTADGAIATPATKDMSGCAGNVVDLAIDRTGKAFVVTDGARELFAIDLGTAKCAKVGALGVFINSLAFGPDPKDPTKDVLWGAEEFQAKLYRIDLGTGAAAFDFDLGGLVPSGDLAYLPGRGLFMTAVGALADDSDRLVFIDPLTRAARVVGELPARNIVALGWKGDRLIGYQTDHSILINPTTAESVLFNAEYGDLKPNGAASGP
jgi:hypothetical protein